MLYILYLFITFSIHTSEKGSKLINYFLCLLLPLILYDFQSHISKISDTTNFDYNIKQDPNVQEFLAEDPLSTNLFSSDDGNTDSFLKSSEVKNIVEENIVNNAVDLADIPVEPVIGKPPGEGKAMPLFGMKHKGTDAIFSISNNLPKLYYYRFVGTLRDSGYNDDIVLAVTPENQMKPAVKEYLQKTKVIAYAYDPYCESEQSCRLRDSFLGYPDPRPYRTLADIRFALYEYWLTYYNLQSYILIVDFRDTYFQAHLYH